MKAGEKRMSSAKVVVLTLLSVIVVFFVIIPLLSIVIPGSGEGNVAVIPIEGVITADGASHLGQDTVSSPTITGFLQEANDNDNIKVIILDINSPGGSAVASDEIAQAIKKIDKPVIAVIREVGASGGYWVASAADHVIANKMSITGSIGVISSYLEFSQLMEKYGVGYEQLTAGEKKDIGTPFRKLTDEERALLHSKLSIIHAFFIDEIAQNRKLERAQVEKLATGEFYLGVEALQLGLVDELGDRDTAEHYIKNTYGITKVEYQTYEEKNSIFDVLTKVMSEFSFHLGQGLGSIVVQQDHKLMLI